MVFDPNIAQKLPQHQYLQPSIGFLKEKKKVILLTLDMSAAFHLLDKSILIPKLAHGFPERIIAINNDSLSDRKAVVQVGESLSEPIDQEKGCVQGIF